jgi:quercetin dioxygenase-like cupin family protein
MHLGNIFETALFEKITSEQVYKEDRFHVVLLRIKQGELLKPHHSTTDAFLTVIEGEVIFILNETPFHLKKGDMLRFKSYETHAAQALQNASLLIVK